MSEEKTGIEHLLADEAAPDYTEDELLVDSSPAGFSDVLSRFGGGTLKTILVILGLGVILWLIWSKGDSQQINEEPKTEVAEVVEPKEMPSEPEVVKQETITKKTVENEEKTEKKGFFSRIFNREAKEKVKEKEVGDSFNLKLNDEQKRKINDVVDQRTNLTSGSVVTQSLGLLRRGESVFTEPLKTQVYAPTANERQQNLIALDEKLKNLETEITKTRTELNQQFTDFSGEETRWKALARQSKTEINRLIVQGQDSTIEKLLKTHADEQDQAYRASTQAEVRRVLSGRLQRLQAGISPLRQMMNANREAIIYDIEVVDFTTDPFRRVLTPAQWRSRQN